MNRDFDPERADQVWAADVTQFWTAEGWLYFAGVIDLFSRRVVGWAMSASPDADLVIDALVMAFERRRPDEKPIHHSERRRGRDLHEPGIRQAGVRTRHHPLVRLHRGLL